MEQPRGHTRPPLCGSRPKRPIPHRDPGGEFTRRLDIRKATLSTMKLAALRAALAEERAPRCVAVLEQVATHPDYERLRTLFAAQTHPDKTVLLLAPWSPSSHSRAVAWRVIPGTCAHPLRAFFQGPGRPPGGAL